MFLLELSSSATWATLAQVAVLSAAAEYAIQFALVSRRQSRLWRLIVAPIIETVRDLPKQGALLGGETGSSTAICVVI
jgi:hypothetical protein